MSDQPRTRALYNGDCPVCDAEMCRYEAYSERENLPIAFDDLNKIDLSDWGVSEDEATRLMHVLHEGQLYVGFEAMLILWEQMPRMRYLAKLCRLPGIFQIGDWTYRNIIARWIYNRHMKRKARGLIGR